MFDKCFKYYKAKWAIPEFGDVLDDLNESDAVSRLDSSVLNNNFGLLFGIRRINTWNCFTLQNHPGLIVIRNPFTVSGMRYWIARCLRDYPKAPNAINLNARIFSKNVLNDWWRELQQCSDKNEARRMKISMRWTTVGYHHNWDTKLYSNEIRNEFPADLNDMCIFFARVLGFTNFIPQAAIINYYPIGSTLAGHIDHSEKNIHAPLFSFSFGQRAIFLIGGKTRDEKPHALFINNGDLLIMSGESRLCYHAIPRVMKAPIEDWNEIMEENNIFLQSQNNEKLPISYDCNMDSFLYNQVSDDIFWTPYKQYLNDSRININIRQVLNEGENCL